MNGTPHDRARLSPAEWEALEEMLSAYALGALGATEAQEVARHLAICPTCRALVDQLAAAIALLPASCEPVEPSPGLKGRVLAAVEAARGGSAAPSTPASPAPRLPTPGALAPPEAPDARSVDAGGPPAAPLRPVPPSGPAAPPAPIPWAGGRAPRAPAWWLALPTAALLLVSLGLGVWNLQLQQDLRRQSEALALYQNARQVWALAGTDAAPGARGTLVEPADGSPLLLTRDLPALPANRAYQVWVIRGGQPLSAHLFPAGAAGQLAGELQQDVAGAQTVAITIEPAGGSAGPTGPIVLAANL